MALNGGQRGDVWGGGEKQKLTDAVGGRCGVYFVCVGVLAQRRVLDDECTLAAFLSL